MSDDRSLEGIYRDLAAARISKQDALDRILALRRKQSDGSRLLLAAPTWQAVSAETGTAAQKGERHVLLCELPGLAPVELQALLPCDGYAVLPSASGDSVVQRYTSCAAACLERTGAILRRGVRGPVFMQWVMPATDDMEALVGLASMLKVASAEHPGFQGQLVLVQPGLTAASLARQLEQAGIRTTEPVLRCEDGAQPMSLRWRKQSMRTQGLVWKERGVYLITGALGRRGLLFASTILAQTRHAQVVLAGSPAKARFSSELQTLQEQSNGRLHHQPIDLRDAQAAEHLIATVVRQWGGIEGILHETAELAQAGLLNQPAIEFERSLAAAIMPAANLDEATKELKLDFFALSCSAASVLGESGQLGVAAADGFLAALAQHRNRLVGEGRRHGRSVAIHWSAWQDVETELDPEALATLENATGMRPLSTAQGMRAFHASIMAGAGSTLAVQGNPGRLKALHGRRDQDLLQPAPRANLQAAEQPSTEKHDLQAKMREFLRKEFSTLLKVPAERLDPQESLQRYGIDSILAMRLTGHLEKTFGPLSKTLLFEHHNLADLATHLVEARPDVVGTLFVSSTRRPVAADPGKGLANRAAAASPVTTGQQSPQARSVGSAVKTPAPAPQGESGSDFIAIVGLSGRYPAARDVAAYWDNLREGRDCIVEVPRERWDWREYYSEDRTEPGRHYSRWGGFIEGVDEFDPQFFNISPREAARIDPQERLFLQHTWMALEDAGCTRADLQAQSRPAGSSASLPGQVGVYAGVMYSEYQLFGVEASMRGQRTGLVGSTASIANRVSYALDLHGPSMTVDTMCSSSLTAIHLACQDLRLGRVRLAIAGGVNVSIHPNKYLAVSAGQFISSDGRCQSFGEGGDGYIPGEGVGVVILKRLSDAERDGDRIYGLIRGSALNHGGRTNGYTVPNPQAQAGAIEDALADAGVDARWVSYLEAHGTGTRLGDPIEIAALSKAFGRTTRDRQFCLIGSAKSNIGHCEAAAGVAGLTKVLLQMRHRQIVPSLHSARLNPHIDFESTPFRVNQVLAEWEAPMLGGRRIPRIAGLSSFGAGGSNAHMIVQEYVATTRAASAPEAAAIVLSARTGGQLRQKASELLQFLQGVGSGCDLAGLAYTLQTGREAMNERLGFVAPDMASLINSLEAFVQGREGAAGIYAGQAQAGMDTMAHLNDEADIQQTLERWLAAGKLDKVLALWVKGLSIPWSALYPDSVPGRISLPSYPFARERYWIDIEAGHVPQEALAGARLHPLVQVNTSSLYEQSYRSNFSGDEAFCYAQRCLDGSVYLEMLRAVAADTLRHDGAVELQDVQWHAPVPVAPDESVVILAHPAETSDLDCEVFSERDGEQIVHVRGRASALADGQAMRLDLHALQRQWAQVAEHAYRHGNDVLVRLDLAWPEQQDSTGYVLHPKMLLALRCAAAEWVAGTHATLATHQPIALDRLRVYARCREQVWAWIRPAATNSAAIDVDLCDGSGTLLAELRGWILAAVEQSDFVQPVWADPCGVRVENEGKGVVTLHVEAAENALTRTVCAAICNALEAARSLPALRVLVLQGSSAHFLQGGEAEQEAVLETGLHRALADFPYPTIAAMAGDALGVGWWLGTLCDVMVCGSQAHHGYTATHAGCATQHASWLHARLGARLARSLCFPAGGLTGAQMTEAGWMGMVVPCAEVNRCALSLAGEFAAKPAEALRLLKAHLADAVHIEPQKHSRVDGKWTSLADASVMRCDHADAASIERELSGLLAEMAASGRYRAIILAAADLSLAASRASDVLALQHCVMQAPVPVLSALSGEVRGASWLLALCCDAMVLDEEGRYGIGSPGTDPELMPALARLTAEYLGEARARETFLTGELVAGSSLGSHSGFAVVAPAEQVLDQARALADTFATQTHDTLAGWKRSRVDALVDAQCQQSAQSVGLERPAPAEGRIPLASQVVSATARAGGVLVIEMHDRDVRNMFSQALVACLEEAFAHAAAEPYKVVVLTGYDHFFASGGTKESLLAIQSGAMRFTDYAVFHIAMRCPVPVIAAMQGHGIGAGWALGLFGDIALHAEEGRYSSPYMNYGFTPGAGATLALPARLGWDLAKESLFAGHEYSGKEVRERGALSHVLPRARVFDAALQMAASMARLPRQWLVTSKTLWSAPLRASLDTVLQQELTMHERTFVGRDDTLTLIEHRFQPASEPARASDMAIPIASSSVNVPDEEVMTTLRRMLAHELQLPMTTLDEKAQFVDLGLDSVVGVTWVRKINEAYGLDLEATRIYGHPTLAQLSRHVTEELLRCGRLRAPALPSQAAVPAPKAAPLFVSAPAPVSAPVAIAQAGPVSTEVSATLRRLLAHELQLPEAQLDEGAQFVDLGLDSVVGVTWVRKINEAYGLDIEATRVYSHPTLAQMSRHVGAELQRHGRLPTPATPMPASRPTAMVAITPPRPVAPAASVRRKSPKSSAAPVLSRPPSIAVVGMAGRFPEASDLHQYWNNLATGRDCITSVSPERWDAQRYYQPGDAAPGRTNSRWLGALDGYDLFDPLFFSISPREAEHMDPQQRLFLQTCWHAFEDAGYSPRALSGSRCGVFVGCAHGDYQQLSAEQRLTAQGFTGNASSILAARISYLLDLQGPCLSIDTACSSSLVAIAHACDSLVNGASDLALAGGVYVMVGPDMHIKTAQAGMLSADGRCFTFDQRANGFVPGEAVGTVVLKRLSDALRDNDTIYGVVEGWGVNQDGRTNGITAPNPHSQTRLQQDVYSRFGIDPGEIQMIEAHGTGTKLGDPIEVEALKASFGKYTQQEGYCALGSVKSNIGHCLTAAGAAGFIKLMLSLQHRQQPPTIHFEHLNEHIRLDGSPFYVNTSLRPWAVPAGKPRRAAMSSFGFGGTNAHVVVAEAPAQAPQEPWEGPELIVLSARSAERLREKVRDMVVYLAREPATSLASVAYTLQVGREAMEDRLSFVAATLAEMSVTLQAFLDGDAVGVHQGQVRQGKGTSALFTGDADLQQVVERWLDHRRLEKLAELWVKGVEWDWGRLHRERMPRRIRLPGYPFARERYWHRGCDAAATESKGAEVIHPLLHANISDLYQHGYRSVFRGDEPFFSAARALHPAAHMEMALAALAHAERLAEGDAILLRDMRWNAPVPIEPGAPVTVALDVAENHIGVTIASAAEEGEHLHCQADSSIVPASTMPRVDLEALQARMRQAGVGRGNAEALVKLPEPATKDAARASLMSMLDAAWREVGGLPDQLSAASSIVFDPFAPMASQAWIRRDAGTWDLDLCDASGVPQWQLRGIAVSDASVLRRVPLAQTDAETTCGPPLHAPRQALLIQVGHGVAEPSNATAEPAVPGSKPQILLPPPRSIDSAALHSQVPVQRPQITLAHTESGRLAACTVRVVDRGDGVVEVRMDAGNGNPLSMELAEALRQALDTAGAIDSLRVLVLLGTREGFLQGRQYASLHESGLEDALADFPYPVIAAMAGHATDAGWWLGSLCDVMVCAAEASYGFTTFSDPWPASRAGALRERFGDLMSERLLSPLGAASGNDWKTRGWSAPVAEGKDVEQHAFAWADQLKSKPAEALRLLKAHLRQASRQSLAAGDAAVAHDAGAWSIVNEPIDIRCDARSIETVSRQLADAVEDARSRRQCRAIILRSDVAPFDGDVQPDALAALQRLIAEAPMPVVAALSGDALGAGWCMALSCDAAVYSESGWYGAADLHGAPVLMVAAAKLAPVCFGDVLGREMLLTGESFTGTALKLRQPALLVAPADGVHSLAREWAAAWLADGGLHVAARKRERLQAWRKDDADALARPCQPASLPAPSTGPIELRSEVIVATAHPGGVLLIQLHDRDAKNMYSPALVEGMKEAFGHVAEHAYKVVVLSGFDSYFASGGTRESLLAIQSGTARFTDQSIFLLPIQCPLPVIAAMQGHGIGAGWSLGLFADVGIYAEESHYVSPYMGYGFTPGAGATLVAPMRLGIDLARESLLSAHEYSGAELRERGLAHAVLPREQVVPAALALATRIAGQPRDYLVRLKQAWNAPLLARLDDVLQKELAMHERTFVGKQETTTRIQARFAELDASATRGRQPAPQPVRNGAAHTPSSIKAKLRETLDAELHLQGRTIDDDDRFVELGMDSIIGVTWIRRINEAFGTSYEATNIYSYPTIREFSAFLQAQLPAAPAPASSSETTIAHESRVRQVVAPPVLRKVPSQSRRIRPSLPEEERIAIVGMSARYPQASDLDAFWANLVRGRDSIVEVPRWRWDVAHFYDPHGQRANTAVSKWLGAMEDVDCFDPLFFRISPEEASLMDPQHRLFLEESYRAFEDAGYAHRELSDKRCGVYLGISTNDYAMMLARHGIMAPPITGNSYSIAAARIAYHLNLKGPAISVDTACSSSLVALHLACQALRSGEVDMALAGGVSLWLTPEQYLSMNEAGMLSPTGQCRAFDAGANGIVMGDGVGAVVLKRLSDAVADGDAIHGVIAGSGVNQDGRTNGITAPSAVSQAELERSVFAKCGIDPGTIGYVETHGTGTRLGDPIELEALTTVFREKTRKVGYCALASLKSNIGHTAAAAGIASVHKVLLSLRHRTIAPTLHVERENPHFAFAESPFYVNRHARPWQSQEGAPLRACINSFGYSGTNAHVIIEEYVPGHRQAGHGSHHDGGGRYALPLSARTSEALHRKVSDLLAYLKSDRVVTLEEIARTLQIGREPMNERFGVLASSTAEFADALQRWLEGGPESDRFKRVRVDGGTHEAGDEQAVRHYLECGDVDSLLAAWMRGADVPWERLYVDGMPRRAHLPTYPFARERHWIEGEAHKPGVAVAGQSGQLGWIEDILDRLDTDELDPAQAVNLLRAVE